MGLPDFACLALTCWIAARISSSADLSWKLAQVRRVGGADVDYEEVCVRPEDAEGVCVIVCRLVQWRDLGLAEVDADGVVRPPALLAPGGEAFGQRARAAVVKTHAVDERLIGHGAEHPGLRIARLRVPSHTAEFTEAEAQRAPDRRGDGLLVHARRETDGVGESEVEEFHRQIPRSKSAGERATQRRLPRRPSQRCERAVVNRLRVLREERRADERTVEPTHARRLANGRRNAKSAMRAKPAPVSRAVALAAGFG